MVLSPQRQAPITASAILAPDSAGFLFGDTAVGGVNHRNHVRNLTTWQPPIAATDVFSTWIRFTEDFATYTAKNIHPRTGRPSVSGYAGAGWAAFLPFDLDHESDPAVTLAELRVLLRVLESLYDLPLAAVRCFWSGGKGFHIEIPATLFGGVSPAPCRVLAARMKRFAEAIIHAAGITTADSSIYEHARIWRLVNTRHSRTGLFKVPLDAAEVLTLDLSAIRSLASAPRAVTWPDDDEWSPNPSLVALWAAAALAIDPGGWQIEVEPSVRFRRPSAIRPLLEAPPVWGADIGELFDFVQVVEDDRPFVLTWLVATLLNGPRVVLLLVGPHGSGKSVSARVLRRLVDPKKDELNRQPDSERDLAIRTQNNLVITLDNVSTIPDWLSDALCTVASGGAFSTRRLHTDDEEAIFEYQRAVLLTSIVEPVTAPDLADRTVTCELPKLRAKEEEARFWERFETARPRLVGALLDAVAVALRHLPDVELGDDAPRMADYARLGVALEPVWRRLVKGEAGFLKRYAAKRRDAETSAADAALITMVLKRFIAERGAWEGTAGELLALLPAAYANDEKQQARLQRSAEWPKTPRKLSGELRRLQPALPAVGIEIGFPPRRRDGSRPIRLR